MAKRIFRNHMTTFEKVMDQVTADGDCLLFTGCDNGHGYGVVWDKDRQGNIPVHVVVAEHHFGPKPDGLLVCHHCDTPRCVNPSHLYFGTPADNMRDRSNRGRAPLGSAHGMSKLTAGDVLKTRTDDRVARLVAADYGVSVPTVKDIRKRRTWAWL